MAFLWMLIGASCGAYLSIGLFHHDVDVITAFLGLVIGFMFAQQKRLRGELAALKQRVEELIAKPAAEPTRDTPIRIALKANSPTTAERPNAGPEESPSAQPPISPMPPPVAANVPAPATPRSVTTYAPPASVVQVARQPAPPDPVQVAMGRVKRWFTEGNVPVKVGVLVLFLGVAALLKYATDAGWLRVPIEVRLAGIALAALAALVFAWRKRDSHRSFALSLQGGAIGILILVVFAAFRVYTLLPPELAFGLLVVIVAATAVLAVAQDALALAVLAVVAGFLAPILVSNGQGNHVVLFGYYAVLNTMIFAIAWIRPWRALNLIGFVFTFGIATVWGGLHYQHELFASTEPFLLLFFAFYLCIPLAYALRQELSQRDLIDSTLVFGAPLVAFPLQAVLLDGARMPLAWSAVAVAAVYVALATLELRRLGLRLLGQSHALLALGFATLAVPLALSARATACAWALEGAVLIWLGLRQQRRLPRWIGYALQAAAGAAFVYGFEIATDPVPLLNGIFFSAMLIAIGGGLSAWLVFRADRSAPLATVFFVWAWAWLWLAFGNDIDRFAPANWQADWALALIAISGALGAFIYRRLDWEAASWPALVSFAAAFPFIGFTTLQNHGPLEHWAVLAWGVWFVASLYSLRILARRANPWLYAVQAAFVWLMTIIVAAELEHVAYFHLQLGMIWVALAALAPLALMFLLVLHRYAVIRWPDTHAAERTRFITLAIAAAALSIAWIFGLLFEGRPAPLPYLPLFNPLELPQLGFLLLMLSWYRSSVRDGQPLLNPEAVARTLALAGFLLLTAITLRSAHFIGGVPWSDAMWNSALAQAALSIVWTIAGIATMLLGKQRGSRAVWIGGGILMGVVIVKLILIDRQHLHDLTAIVGVLVVGMLLVGVGYFAPVPPRSASETA